MSLDDGPPTIETMKTIKTITIINSKNIAPPNDFLNLLTTNLLKNLDTKLYIDDKELTANSLMLRSQSTVFEKMLCGEMKEEDIKSIQLDGHKYHIVKSLIDHMHNQDIETTYDTIIELTECANYYAYDQLLTDCKTTLKSILTKENAYKYYLESMTYHMDELMQICEEYICTNITSNEMISSMVDVDDGNDLIYMITSCKTQYTIHSEYALFNTIVKFIDENKAYDKHKSNKLIELIDINKLTLEEVLTIENSDKSIYLSAEKLREFYKCKLKKCTSVSNIYKGTKSNIFSIKLAFEHVNGGWNSYSHNLSHDSQIVDY